MQLRRHVAGIERGRLLSPRGRTPNIETSDRARFADDCGASGNRLIVGNVSDANSGDVGKSFHSGLYACMVASRFGETSYLLDLLKEPVLAVQEFFFLTGRALRNIFRSPHYAD